MLVYPIPHRPSLSPYWMDIVKWRRRLMHAALGPEDMNIGGVKYIHSQKSAQRMRRTRQQPFFDHQLKKDFGG